MRTTFYYQTIKNIIAAFGMVFNDVHIINDNNDDIRIPLHFSQKEKFVEYWNQKSDLGWSDDEIQYPRMGFEIIGMNFAPERFNNPLGRMQARDQKNDAYMFSRIPYDFTFNLYVGTRKLEDSFKIIEQIVPFFTPELNLSIKDKEDFDLVTDIPVVLNSVGFDINYEGSFLDKRTILWTLSFTVKAWLYGNINTQTRIKEAVAVMSQPELDKVFSTITEEVLPRSANKTDPHSIVETIVNGK